MHPVPARAAPSWGRSWPSLARSCSWSWWIQHPQIVDPKTAMPQTGIGPADALDLAAYLYSID
jgi:hypothetical protein